MWRAVAPPPLSTSPAALGQGRGGDHRSARISGPQVLRRRRLTPNVRWCAGPCGSVWVPCQSLRRGRCRPALRQQQDGVPPLPLPLPGCGSQNHPPPQVLDSHLPLFQRPVYLPHAHHQPLPTPNSRHQLTRFLHKFTPCVCAFHLGFGLGWLSKCRAILVRYEEKPSNYLGLLQLAYALIWYRRRCRLAILR